MMMQEIHQLGARLRSARQDRGWTLDDLAGRAGMSPSTLSRLESGKRQATLELLLPLTQQLGIRIDDLLEAPESDPRIRRASVEVEGMSVAALTREESEVRAYKIIYRPDETEKPQRSHPGNEWVYVLSGKLQLSLGSQTIMLGRGEAAEFDTTTPHRLRAVGNRPAETISIFNSVGERLHLHNLG